LSEPPRSDAADDLPLLREFIVRLGGAMVVAGDSIDSVHRTLDTVARAYGRGRFEFFVLPTGLFVESGEGASAHVQLSAEQRGAKLRFDQIAALYQLVRRAERAELAPAAGLGELAAIASTPPPRGRLMRTAGHAVLTGGLALLLQPTAGGLLAALALGALVGVLKLPRLATLDLIFPVAAAFVVAVTVFGITQFSGVGDNPMRVLIPPLATFLPGGLLTIATVELAAGEVISGASRLVNGFVQLGLLAFGIVAAAALVGIDDRFLTDDPVSRLGWWAPWAGILLIALGDHLHFAAPARTVPWILLVLVTAYAAQTAGGAVFGAELSGFFGAVAMTPLVLWIDSRAYGAPSMVTFLPGFWLLVPGAIGLIGLTEMIGVDRTVGSDELSTMLTTVVSIALGVLIGSAAFRTATAGVRRVASTLPALPPPWWRGDRE
jgi:uncharacterized membrane protein YjjP (DUF1212 family)